MQLTHGGDWAGFLERHGSQPLDFSANVSPLGLPGGVAQAIRQAVEQVDRYPDPLCRGLRQGLSRHEGVPMEQILCGNGAADLIFRVVLARRPRLAVVTAPTFAEYAQALDTVGCTVHRHLLSEANGFALTPDILEAITPGVEMVFLCEPNNPTGLASPRELLVQVVERCAQVGALLVLDECFGDLLDDPSAHTLAGLLPRYPNLLILKAFTKLYAMAGVRLGYCLCSSRELLAAMQAAGQPWAVSTLAQAAGLAALEEQDYVARVRALVQEQRPWLAHALTGLGLRVIPGQANYLLFYSPAPLSQPLEAMGILIRSCANYPGLGEGWYRVGVRTAAENQRLAVTLRQILCRLSQNM